MFIALSVIGFAAVLGLFVGANLEERKLLPVSQHIEQHPTDLEEAVMADNHSDL